MNLGRDVRESNAIARRGAADTLALGGGLLFRSLALALQAHRANKTTDQILGLYKGEDRELVATMLKAVVAPASTQTPGWAAELFVTQVDGFIETLARASVYAQLATRGFA